MSTKHLTLLAFALTLTCQRPAMAEQPGHVTGLGGVFVKSKDPKALAQWYREVLGLDVKSWGGAALPFDAPGHPPKVSWTAFPDSSDYLSPSTREFMINFAVDDMDAILARDREGRSRPEARRQRSLRQVRLDPGSGRHQDRALAAERLGQGLRAPRATSAPRCQGFVPPPAHWRGRSQDPGRCVPPIVQFRRSPCFPGEERP